MGNRRAAVEYCGLSRHSEGPRGRKNWLTDPQTDGRTRVTPENSILPPGAMAGGYKQLQATKHNT